MSDELSAASSPPEASTVTLPPLPGVAPYETTTAEEEYRYLNYIGHQIPWAVRLVWILFWTASIWYVLRWLFPALQGELLAPP